MTRDNLVDLIAKTKPNELKLTKKETKGLLLLIENLIIESLENGEDVKLAKFINFTIVDIKERERINLKTGELFTSPARKKVKVKIGSSLKYIGK